MELYNSLYKKVEIQKQNFELILSNLKEKKNEETKLSLAMYASTYATFHNTGYFTSSILENIFMEYGQNIKIDLSNINYKKNTFLHVMTEGYLIGGHTRVVERWIENAPSNQKHSVVLIQPNSSDLMTLKNNIKMKNGDYIQFDNKLDIKQKAIDLRKIGMSYEFIILHTHMDDPTAIIAFGTKDFTRPILFYNHASHLFWLGKNISDLVLDIEKDDEVTKVKRDISNTYFLGVPSKEINLTTPDKINLRKKLKLPIDKKIIVTSGGQAKYRTICGNSFIDYLKEIVNENTYCYVIGVEATEEWKNIEKISQGHIKPLGHINFDDGYLDYLSAADLYLDSYPLCGGTATIDAISAGTPILSLKSVYPQFDYLTCTKAYCQTKEEFIQKAKYVLEDINYSSNLLDELRASLIKYQSKEAWKKKIEELIKIAPTTHKLNNTANGNDYNKIDDLAVLCNVITNKNFIKEEIKKIHPNELEIYTSDGALYKKRGIPFIFQVLSYKKMHQKVKIIKLFNIKIYTHKK